MFDFATYQLRSYFRVHLFHFIVTPLIGGLFLHVHHGIAFLDCWFACQAAMTGGSLLTFDVSRLDRYGEVVIYVCSACPRAARGRPPPGSRMRACAHARAPHRLPGRPGAVFVGGVTIMCVPPALNRMYIFRTKLRPALVEARALTVEVLALAREAEAEGAEQLAEDVKDFDAMEAEYALKDAAQEAVATIAGVYTACWHGIGSAVMYSSLTAKAKVAEYVRRGIGNAWFAVFMTCSSFNNVGLSLLDDSMIPFTDRPAALMLMAFAMIFGNTAWPIAFRGITYALARLNPGSRALRYMLDEPGNCSASLFNTLQTCACACRMRRGRPRQRRRPRPPPFPSHRASYGLCAAVVVTNVFMVILFMACSADLDGIRYSPDGERRTNLTLLYLAFFQCSNTRSSGLQVFDLKALSKNMLVVFGFMMWYAPTPLVGVLGGEEFTMAFHDNPILSGFIKKYLNRHTSWLFVVFLIISTAEQPLLAGSAAWPPPTQPGTSLFNVLFEMLSAYGTNGLSMGFPGVNHSLSGMFRPVSKLAIMFLMVLGRHRSMSGAAAADAGVGGWRLGA